MSRIRQRIQSPAWGRDELLSRDATPPARMGASNVTRGGAGIAEGRSAYAVPETMLTPTEFYSLLSPASPIEEQAASPGCCRPQPLTLHGGMPMPRRRKTYHLLQLHSRPRFRNTFAELRGKALESGRFAREQCSYHTSIHDLCCASYMLNHWIV